MKICCLYDITIRMENSKRITNEAGNIIEKAETGF